MKSFNITELNLSGIPSTDNEKMLHLEMQDLRVEVEELKAANERLKNSAQYIKMLIEAQPDMKGIV